MDNDTNKNFDPSTSANVKHKRIPRVNRPNVLLAVTGSVAGIKGPEIAVKLIQQVHVNVRVLLTRGGKNFWSKSKDYNLQYWDEMSSFLNSGDDPARIEIIGKILSRPTTVVIRKSTTPSHFARL